jgi:hypothetical protein
MQAKSMRGKKSKPYDAPKSEANDAREPKPAAVPPKYEATETEKSALGEFLAPRAKAPPAPRLKVSKNGSAAEVGPDHPDNTTGYTLLAQALGSTDVEFVNGLIRQLVNAGSQGREPNEAETNFLLSVIKGVKPRDEVEAMMAAQMAAIHTALMTLARRRANAQSLPQQDSAARALNNFARTYAMQLEALKRYRTGGEQRVTVQHVTVSEGGQAIVANVTQSAREPAPAPAKPQLDAAPIPALTDARMFPMPAMSQPEPEPIEARVNKRDVRRSSP